MTSRIGKRKTWESTRALWAAPLRPPLRIPRATRRVHDDGALARYRRLGTRQEEPKGQRGVVKSLGYNAIVRRREVSFAQDWRVQTRYGYKHGHAAGRQAGRQTNGQKKMRCAPRQREGVRMRVWAVGSGQVTLERMSNEQPICGPPRPTRRDGRPPFLARFIPSPQPRLAERRSRWVVHRRGGAGFRWQLGR